MPGSDRCKQGDAWLSLERKLGNRAVSERNAIVRKGYRWGYPGDGLGTRACCAGYLCSKIGSGALHRRATGCIGLDFLGLASTRRPEALKGKLAHYLKAGF